MEFLSQNDIYIVLVISCIVWLGFSFLILRFDRRVSNLEKLADKTNTRKERL